MQQWEISIFPIQVLMIVVNYTVPVYSPLLSSPTYSQAELGLSL